ncbi:flagellar brake protein [Bacillus sp. FJAT-45037]|uniref:flagellar brake protein n=1 Tax=Bacillus sp. FJAT-45037 TaxID=2011007 RepID=UPI000C244227|nr:flagellar brake domain-containing protein [Bacillus sp. FJAT-45037]
MIEIGTTIQLELEDESNKEKTTKLRCRLVDIVNDTYIIDYPINLETRKPSFLLDGTKMKASFISSQDVVYEFNTEVLGRQKHTIPVLLIQDPGKENYYRIQRRNYVRVEATNDVAVHPVDEEYEPFNTVSIDISGGGCAILLPKEKAIPDNGEVDVTMVLPRQKGEQQYVKARCKIVRTYQPRPEAKMRASLQFIGLEQKDQDKIVRFCFERQLVLRRKNRG